MAQGFLSLTEVVCTVEEPATVLLDKLSKNRYSAGGLACALQVSSMPSFTTTVLLVKLVDSSVFIG